MTPTASQIVHELGHLVCLAAVHGRLDESGFYIVTHGEQCIAGHEQMSAEVWEWFDANGPGRMVTAAGVAAGAAWVTLSKARDELSRAMLLHVLSRAARGDAEDLRAARQLLSFAEGNVSEADRAVLARAPEDDTSTVAGGRVGIAVGANLYESDAQPLLDRVVKEVSARGEIRFTRRELVSIIA